MVVWNKKSGDFNNATINPKESENLEEVSKKFENEYPDYRVIHIGEGELPPKTYRSLDYIW